MEEILSPSARLIRTNARDTARRCNFITIMSTTISSRNIQRRRQKEKDCEHDHDIRRGLNRGTALYNGKQRWFLHTLWPDSGYDQRRVRYDRW